MQNEELLDDFQFQAEDDGEVYLEPASQAQRFFNNLIDNIILRVMVYFIAYGIGSSTLLLDISDGMVVLLVFFFLFVILGYYWVSEYALGGRTIGKFITGTKVVYDDGSQPSATSILGRTLARLVPFEALSIFFDSDGLMWHDKWSHTMVIDVKKSTLPNY